MLKRGFLERMQKDEELQELRRKVYAITGKREDIAFCAGRYTLEEWKEQLRQIVKEHNTTQS